MAAHDDHDEDKPLDPATERVRRKMVRLLAISIAIMAVGLMAVLGGIVYKIAYRPDSAGTAAVPDALSGLEPGTEGRIVLPGGARLISAGLDGAHVLLRVALAGGGEALLVYSLPEDRIIARVAIE